MENSTATSTQVPSNVCEIEMLGLQSRRCDDNHNKRDTLSPAHPLSAGRKPAQLGLLCFWCGWLDSPPPSCSLGCCSEGSAFGLIGDG